MKLCELLENKAVTSIGDAEISGVTDDTRKVGEGSLFVCVKGGRFDGHSAAAEMLEKGAAAVVCDHDLGLGEKQIIVDNTRRSYGELCAAWFGHPEKKLKMIGVTGTNGKTTITNIIKHILMKNGHKTGLVGTIQNEIGGEVLHTDNTTPMTHDFMELLAKMVEADCEYVVMEVSSFGLVQNRIGSSHFEVAAFTNLTQDHLDYHKDMEDYYQAKKLLFGKCDTALINIDDDYGKRLFDETECRKLSFSIKQNSDYYADGIKLKAAGSSFWFCKGEKSHLVRIMIPGLFNVSNVTCAIAVCMELGISLDDIISAVEEYPGVKGRCEIIPTGRDFTVICDYAHTPDAIENVLKSVREYTENRLICLFGCGGNRSKLRRYEMGEVSGRLADLTVITSDNPRDEEPQAIIDDIKAGMAKTEGKYVEIPDRKEAIAYAIHHGEPGDIVVLAGKGHEDYQEIKGKKYPMDERVLIADILAGK